MTFAAGGAPLSFRVCSCTAASGVRVRTRAVRVRRSCAMDKLSGRRAPKGCAAQDLVAAKGREVCSPGGVLHGKFLGDLGRRHGSLLRGESLVHVRVDGAEAISVARAEHLSRERRVPQREAAVAHASSLCLAPPYGLVVVWPRCAKVCICSATDTARIQVRLPPKKTGLQDVAGRTPCAHSRTR